MTMVYCRGCAKEIHESAPTCPHCGCVQPLAAATPSLPARASGGMLAGSLDKKFHLTLIVSALIAVLLLYATNAIPLIGAATGLSFGLSIRLFITHKKRGFAGTNQWDWVAIALFTTAALILFLTQNYTIQGPLLVFVALRSLILYFKIYDGTGMRVPDSKQN